MLTCPTHLPIYFCTTPVDFRKSFDGLTGVITAVFGSSVLDSHLFLFINKRRDRIPIDNNDVEQLMKQVATGRKNWLFLGSPDAGDRAATLLTLISTALRHDLDVWAYLKAAIDQLQAGSTDYHSLRPDVWKLAHPEFVRAYRTEERRDAATRTRQTRAQRRLANAKKQSAR